jgi:hypothetical protein
MIKMGTGIPMSQSKTQPILPLGYRGGICVFIFDGFLSAKAAVDCHHQRIAKNTVLGRMSTAPNPPPELPLEA